MTRAGQVRQDEVQQDQRKPCSVSERALAAQNPQCLLAALVDLKATVRVGALQHSHRTPLLAPRRL
jgi:hypothetical protein